MGRNLTVQCGRQSVRRDVCRAARVCAVATPALVRRPSLTKPPWGGGAFIGLWRLIVTAPSLTTPRRTLVAAGPIVDGLSTPRRAAAAHHNQPTAALANLPPSDANPTAGVPPACPRRAERMRAFHQKPPISSHRAFRSPIYLHHRIHERRGAVVILVILVVVVVVVLVVVIVGGG